MLDFCKKEGGKNARASQGFSITHHTHQASLSQITISSKDGQLLNRKNYLHLTLHYKISIAAEYMSDGPEAEPHK